MLATLRQRNSGLLWSAGLISMIGDWALLAALPFYVYNRTESTLASGLILFAAILPALLFGSVVGVLVDRWNRRTTMVTVSLLQGLLLLGLLVARGDGWLWLVYPVMFGEWTLAQFFGPAESALLPQLVGDDRLLQANVLNSLNGNLARVVGPAIGGVLLAWTGLSGAVLVDVGSFLAAAALIAAITTHAPAAPAEAEGEETAARAAWVDLWRDWMAGLGLIRTDRLLRAVFLVAGVGMLADGMLGVLLVPFIKEVVKGGAEAFGAVLTIRGVSDVLGGLVIGRIGTRVRLGNLIGWGLVAIGLGFVVMVNVPTLPVVFGIMLALGPAIEGWLTSEQTLLQTGTTDRFRGRVFGAFGTSSALATLIGTGVGSGLGDPIGIVVLLDVAGGFYVLAGVLALGRLRVATPGPLTPSAHQAGRPLASEPSSGRE